MPKSADKIMAGHTGASPEGGEWRDAGMAERNDRQARLAARLGLPRFAIRLLGERRARGMTGKG
ncbi:MAG: hypothetical protein K0Q55_417 [Verrucomicrobia bacterium]|jgi:hypothetical protein|nr:hypothetical protein [Verrucomicrobiota bacterium]